MEHFRLLFSWTRSWADEDNLQVEYLDSRKMGRVKQTKKMAKQRFAQIQKRISLKDPRIVAKIDPKKVSWDVIFPIITHLLL